MKHLKTITTALMILFFAVSCKKQSVDPVTPVPTAKKLQHITWTPGYSVEQNYTYDIQGRLTKEEDAHEIVTFEFNSNTVSIKEFKKSENRFVSDISGTTDNAGRITSLTGNFSYTANSPYTEQVNFTYDADGYLTQFKRTRPNSLIVFTYDYTVTDGDYTKMVYSVTGGSGATQITEFYTDKKDISGVNYLPLGYGFNNGLFGKVNTHLVKHDQSTATGVLVPSWTKSLSYTLDNEGYVQTVDLTGYWTASATYSFQ
jgi:hypothetical protein